MYPSQGSSYNQAVTDQAVTCNQHFDYCLIELETSLTIGPFVQAIGIEEPKPSSWSNQPISESIFPINIGQSTIKPTLTSVTATTFTSTEGSTFTTTITSTVDSDSDSDTNHIDGPNLERCWIAAWSDDILRTSFAELEDSWFGSSGSGFKDAV